MEIEFAHDLGLVTVRIACSLVDQLALTARSRLEGTAALPFDPLADQFAEQFADRLRLALGDFGEFILQGGRDAEADRLPLRFGGGARHYALPGILSRIM